MKEIKREKKTSLTFSDDDEIGENTQNAGDNFQMSESETGKVRSL